MNEKSPSLLLVEDDPLLQRSLKRGLIEQGYHVLAAKDLHSARPTLQNEAIDLVLLDLNLPDGSGFDFLAELRKQREAMPVLIMSARAEMPDKIRGLDLGADDYLVKPFDFSELCARIRVRLRRVPAPADPVLAVGDLMIDLVTRTVKRGDVFIDCTPREFDVLVYLARIPGQTASREQLTRDVWKVKSRMTSMDNVIDVLMSRLREKVDGAYPVKLIQTVRGIGFMMKAPP